MFTMEIIVDRKLILNKFLIPLNKFTDQAIITLNKEYIDCVSYSTNDKQSIVFYSKLLIKSDITDPNDVKLNIGSVKKFINALNCVNYDIIKLTVEKNHIAYNSPETNFRFHLKEDGTIEKPTINLEKINAMDFDTEIEVTAEKIDEILKASNVSTDSNKIYLYVKDDIFYAELTDKNIQNLDTVTVMVTNQIIKSKLTEPVPLRLDIFRLLSSIKFDKLNIKLNNKGVVVFEIKEDNYLMKYITSSLIK